ncbi:hypothetical protein ACMD2_10454, partial [Ananas comosus]
MQRCDPIRLTQKKKKIKFDSSKEKEKYVEDLSRFGRAHIQNNWFGVRREDTTVGSYRILSPQQQEARKLFKEQLASIIRDEELLWKSRARQQWLREGDGNTKFFHAVANGRRRENSIDGFEDDGRIILREEDKRDYFFRKFSEIFAPAVHGDDKATGPDGFNLMFYQTFWDVVKDDLFFIFFDLYD